MTSEASNSVKKKPHPGGARLKIDAMIAAVDSLVLTY